MRELVEIQRGAGPALDRIDALELSRHQFEAEIQGVLLKSEGKLKAASNAEARERQLKRSYERRLDEGDPDGEARSEAEAVHGNDDSARDEERVPPLRLDVAADRKAHALRHKFGV